MKEWKEKILDDGDIVSFVSMTNRLGRAEFICCPVFRYGKLKEFYIYPAQQENTDTYYKILFNYSPLDFSIGVSPDLLFNDEPRIWLHFWCKEHKCQSFRLYVPRKSNQFRIEKLSNFSVVFGNNMASSTLRQKARNI